MKTSINKSVKRALSVVLCLAVALGSLFTANIGININADAATVDTTGLKISYWTGAKTKPTTTDSEGNILITSADELCGVAFNTGSVANYGAKFKIDTSKVDVIILQKEADVVAAGGVEKLLSLSSAAEVKAFFEGMTSKTDWYSGFAWADYNATSFDGCNVPIYGLYSIGGTATVGNQNIGLFAQTDAGNPGTSSSDVSTDDTGITYKNIIVRNSYMVSARRLGAIVSMTNGSGFGCYVNGVVNIENCEVSNNYMLCDGSTSGYGTGEAGVLLGTAGSGDVVKIKNCLVYGNDATHTDGTTTSNLVLTRGNQRDDTLYSRVENSIILGTSPSAYLGSNATYSAVYTDQSSSYTGVTNIGSATAAYGAFGKINMPDLDWSTNSTDATWYAIDGALPVLVKPDDWTDVENIEVWDGTKADAFASGSGTEADPYIIENGAQLNKMVYDGGRSSDGTTENYYKVADGVDSIYLNLATDCAAVEALVAGGTYNKWSFGTTTFNGKFDGNGATIYGMVSNASNVGFVPVLGYNAVIKNVTFSAAYVTGTRAAVITTSATSYADNGDNVFENIYITNVAVINSYIRATYSYAANGTAAGFIATGDTPDIVYLTNCVFDGGSCTLIDGGTDRDVSARAGMVSFPNWGNNFVMENCVSIDAYIVPMVTSVAQNTTSGTWYQRYPIARTSKVAFANCYSDINPVMYDSVTVDGTTYQYDRITNNVNEIVVTTEGVYDKSVMPTLDWANTWELVEVSSGHFIPMPTKDGVEGEYTSYSEMIAAQQDGRGANTGRPYIDGTSGLFHEFTGAGTADDPYIIYTAFELARAIGAGGVNLNDTLYFKLANDIDLSGMSWINQTSIESQYTYVPFKGTLDGDGHTITGMSASDKAGAGLIPVLAGGTVKNLHIRDSYAGSMTENSAGLIAGVCEADSVITGCSVESCETINSGATITGNWGVASVTYSYINDGTTSTYYDATANATLAADEITVDGTIWYIGGAEGSEPKLVNRAETMVYTDVAGDDNGEEYDTNDLVALRRNLLKKAAYQKIYGDVTRDGAINLIDLAVLCRQMGDDYGQIEDGFWAAVANSKMAIYYSENDTMDMARKLELYLEAAVPGLDIEKYATVVDTNTTDGISGVSDPTAVQGTPDGTFDIVLVDSNDATNYANYSVAYDEDNAVLTITGGSFTAVEQAVLAFAAGSDYKSDVLYIGSGSIDTDTMGSKTINGVTYYYAWGDEFNTGTTYSTDNWNISSYKYEEHDSSGKEIQTGTYWNKENPNVSDLTSLYEITSDGQLKMWRGLESSAYNEATHSWGYKPVDLDPDGDGLNDFGQYIEDNDIYVDPGLLTTDDSMLFKQGYIEMKGTLPSDGHAFPAWWFLTGPTITRNNYFDSTLYDKVYILNNAANGSKAPWTGVNQMVASDLSTYKYQIPTCHLEFDIVEVMQAPQNNTMSKNYLQATSNYNSYASGYKGTYISETNLTVHKIYNENAYDGNLYIPNWSTGVSTLFSSADNFGTTSSAGTFIHNYNTSAYTNAYDFGNINKMQGEHIFGFAWTVDESEGNYTLTVYVDGTAVMTINEDVGHVASNDPTYTATNGDADIWNQYAYMLLDNSFYSSNPYYTSNPAANFTDLLTQDSKAYGLDSSWNTLKAADKATFEVDYVRVYQQNNMRDIVTSETEDFNNGNRFGYGK